MSYYKDLNFTFIKGMTLMSAIQNGNNEIRFLFSDGRKFLMNHTQDCCESVNIESIDGNLSDIIGDEIINATEDIISGENGCGTWTKTIFTITTAKTSVVIKWFGGSNGYYSESVSFHQID